MKTLCVLCMFLVVCSFASASSDVPERNQESEQRIDSMMVNQSAGNMTGEDYVLALMYAYINDTINSNSINDLSRPSFRAVQNEAISKFGYYSEIYTSNKLEIEFSDLMSDSTIREYYVEDGSKYSNLRYVMPEQGRIDLCIYCLFHNDTECKIVYPDSYSTGFNEDLNEARAAYQTRITEEAELKAKQEKREADRLLKQQENEARQAALDAHYKALYENYTARIDDLVNNESLGTAIALATGARYDLVSPYSNLMAIREGDLLVEGTKSRDNHRANIIDIVFAADRYDRALENFTYSNESKDYQDAIYRDFMKKWSGIIELKKGITKDRFLEEFMATSTDLRDAPNVKQLLSGKIKEKYETTVINYTDTLVVTLVEEAGASDGSYCEHPGYWVQVNLSADNDPGIDATYSDLSQKIPTYIDIFSSLFKDERISLVVIQLNETYYDRFGHTKERPIMMARLDNVTATEIGDWTTFKKYIGKDMDRFEQVVEKTIITY